MSTVRVAALQLGVGSDQADDLARAAALLAEAAAAGAQLAVLPERFAQWAPDSTIPTMAEPVPGPLTDWLAGEARTHGIHLIGGSLLERVPGVARPYNTSLLFGPDGALLARYRKIHLFDADVGVETQGINDLPVGKWVRHGESTTVAPGDAVVTAQTPLGVLGLSICYDLRFPELYRALAERGAQIIAIPAGFTRPTGQAHWEILLRARAIENQCFVIAACSCGTYARDRDFFGHSMIVDPWGVVLAQRADGEGIVLADLELAALDTVRARMPVLRHRRLGLAAPHAAVLS